MMPLLLLLVTLAGRPTPPPAPQAQCGYLVSPQGERISLSALFGEPLQAVQWAPCPGASHRQAFLGRRSQDPPVFVYGLVENARLVARYELTPAPDEVRPFVTCLGNLWLLVRPSIGELTGYTPEGTLRFRRRLPGTDWNDEPTVQVISLGLQWAVAWQQNAWIHLAVYDEHGTLQAHDSLAGFLAQMVAWQERPLILRYTVQEERIQDFALVDPSGRVWLQSPAPLRLWPLSARTLLMNQGNRWFLWRGPGDTLRLPLQGRYRVFVDPSGGRAVLLSGTWHYEGPDQRAVFQLRRVFWLTEDGILHHRDLSAPLASTLPVEFQGQTFVVKSCSHFWRLP